MILATLPPYVSGLMFGMFIGLAISIVAMVIVLKVLEENAGPRF